MTTGQPLEQRPRLDTAEAISAYRRELRAVGRPLRLAGVGLIVAGAFLQIYRVYGPGDLPQWSEMAVYVLLFGGWGVMMAAIVRRLLYHRRRMAGR